jgi:hypothetical protein
MAEDLAAGARIPALVLRNRFSRWLRSGWDAPIPYQYSREDERSFLKQQVEYLSKTIEDINKRLQNWKKKDTHYGASLQDAPRNTMYRKII